MASGLDNGATTQIPCKNAFEEGIGCFPEAFRAVTVTARLDHQGLENAADDKKKQKLLGALSCLIGEDPEINEA